MPRPKKSSHRKSRMKPKKVIERRARQPEWKRSSGSPKPPSALGRSYRREHAGEEPPLTVNERARLRELQRETRELKMESEFLKKAAADFARDHR